MKLRATVVLVVALAAGVGAFAWRTVRVSAAQTPREPELRWLQREFALSDEAMRRIIELHRRYTAECESMCATLRASDAEVTRLLVTDKSSIPGLKTALDRSNKIVADCQLRMLDHFQAVAKEMPPAARKRYLALMTPIATHPDRDWTRMAPHAP